MKFTIDWEPWFALYPYSDFWEKNDPLVTEVTYYLRDLLRRHNIKATWYCVGWLVENSNLNYQCIKAEGHVIGYHSYYHKHDPADIPQDRPYRAPKFKGEKKYYSGGFWFRVMPYWWIKREVLKTGMFYIHPHDIMLEHPECGWRTFDRLLGLKTSRDKLERLVREIKFETFVLEPSVTG